MQTENGWCFIADVKSVSYKTRNQPKPAKTSKITKTTHNQPKPLTTSQNYPKLAELSKNQANKQRFCAVVHLEQNFRKYLWLGPFYNKAVSFYY